VSGQKVDIRDEELAKKMRRQRVEEFAKRYMEKYRETFRELADR
jgi:hypothetical protein